MNQKWSQCKKHAITLGSSPQAILMVDAIDEQVFSKRTYVFVRRDGKQAARSDDRLQLNPVSSLRHRHIKFLRVAVDMVDPEYCKPRELLLSERSTNIQHGLNEIRLRL